MLNKLWTFSRLRVDLELGEDDRPGELRLPPSEAVWLSADRSDWSPLYKVNYKLSGRFSKARSKLVRIRLHLLLGGLEPEVLHESHEEDEEFSFCQRFTQAHSLPVTKGHKILRFEELSFVIQKSDGTKLKM